MSDRRAEARSILDASPHAARWAWIINGFLFAIGASVSTLVYLSGPGSGGIMRRAEDVSKESVESHLFSLPVFQLILFLIPLMMDLNWRRFQLEVEHSVQLQRAQDSRYEQLNMALVYFGVCFLLVFMESFVFVMALAPAFIRPRLQ